MKHRTASDWLEWAEKLAYYSNMTWHGQVTGVDYSIAAKILAEKCEELQQEIMEISKMLEEHRVATLNRENNDTAQNNGRLD